MAGKAGFGERAPKVKNIRNFEQLISAIGKVAEGQITLKDINISTNSMTIDVKIDGPTWDQRIDYRGAQFVQNIQREISSLYKKFPKYLPGEAPIIKVRVRKGSNLLSPEFIDIVKHALNIMGPTNITIAVIVTVVCAAGCGIYWRHRASIEAAKPYNLAQNAINAVLEMARKAGVDPNAAERPIKTLAKKLGDLDTLRVGKRPELNGFIARKLVEIKQPRTPRESYPCDGAFLLCKINLKYPKHSIVLELEQDGKPINAFTEKLPSSVAKLLLDRVNEKRNSNELPFPIELQIDVFCTKKKISYGSIVALGKPRGGLTHWKLKDLPQKSKPLPLLSYTQLPQQAQLPEIE